MATALGSSGLRSAPCCSGLRPLPALPTMRLAAAGAFGEASRSWLLRLAPSWAASWLCRRRLRIATWPGWALGRLPLALCEPWPDGEARAPALRRRLSWLGLLCRALARGRFPCHVDRLTLTKVAYFVHSTRSARWTAEHGAHMRAAADASSSLLLLSCVSWWLIRNSAPPSLALALYGLAAQTLRSSDALNASIAQWMNRVHLRISVPTLFMPTPLRNTITQTSRTLKRSAADLDVAGHDVLKTRVRESRAIVRNLCVSKAINDRALGLRAAV